MTALTRGTSVAAQLQQLILDNPGMELFLEAFAGQAAELFSDPDQLLCSITLKRDKRAQTVASSSTEANQLDELQYGYGDGPCLYAAESGELTLVADTRTGSRWIEYFEAIHGLGCYSVLAVPLLIGDDGGAALNLYGKSTGIFTDDFVHAVEDYAAEAAVTLQVAVQIANHKEVSDDLRKAMESRTAIDIAVGIVAGQNRCSQGEAFGILRRASSHQNIKLRELAERLVESVTAAKVATHFA
ncbi:GAF and ANTAR domain-containing protein [Arthrobacter sp. zg-Y1110]|uniref:GAF and ANTAR domain-containing protein n=1 Tax=Arthrobacter sp. zg-Y1110 TaxID=2886932 RepID=UPI001D13CC14|nr:GAF and ANTAR domain-containing protein [Arthrobacter sp. zg-Y1110]MCC3289757.1 GAF and ANTAR domain-containing protein [Arthrobacter sp. zg-Y1110]UWX84825.1 GAF and ANTAR domain-containing protein [Arthrobacter sp. zg-Y1110]